MISTAAQSTSIIKVAAVILTYNEEHFIEDCLKHLEPYVDHILVIDGCSTDKTLDIANGLANQVICRPFSDSFAFERNEAHWRLPPEYNWILMCDADERFNIEFLKGIKQIITKNNVYCFRFPRINEDRTYLEKLINKQDHQVRLYNRSKCRWIRNVHEILALAISDLPADQYSVKELSQYPILHLKRPSSIRKEIQARWDNIEKQDSTTGKTPFFQKL